MDKKFLKKCFYFIFVCVLINVALCACTLQKIEVKRESAFDNSLDDTKNYNKGQLTKSKNIYIYNTQAEKGKINTRFGPKDINFDLPLTH